MCKTGQHVLMMIGLDELSKSELARQSPKVFAFIKETLEVAEMAVVTKAYGTAGVGKVDWEGPIIREPGASFNPRPARLCEILIKEGGVRESNLLAAVILAVLPPELLKEQKNKSSELAPEIFDIAIASARDVSLLADTPNKGRVDVIKIIAAKSLDLVRHLHMTSLSKIEKIEIIKRIEESVLPLLESEHVFGRLSISLSTAIRLYKRRL